MNLTNSYEQNLENYLEKLQRTPEIIGVDEAINLIDEYFHFKPVSFKNGKLFNEAGQNSGSCKIFAFARLNDLPVEKTLHCFGEYYRKDVRQNPQGVNHQNIRNFMVTGWAGIHFDDEPLQKK